MALAIDILQSFVTVEIDRVAGDRCKHCRSVALVQSQPIVRSRNRTIWCDCGFSERVYAVRLRDMSQREDSRTHVHMGYFRHTVPSVLSNNEQLSMRLTINQIMLPYECNYSVKSLTIPEHLHKYASGTCSISSISAKIVAFDPRLPMASSWRRRMSNSTSSSGTPSP